MCLYTAQKNRAKNTPATRMTRALRHRLRKVQQQITPLLVTGVDRQTTRSLAAEALNAPSLPEKGHNDDPPGVSHGLSPQPPWSVGPVEPEASPPERSAAPPELPAAPL